MSSKSIHHFIVYIPDEKCYGMVQSMGAFASTVRYNKDGIEYEVFILNEDLVFLEDVSIGLEEEEF